MKALITIVLLLLSSASLAKQQSQWTKVKQIYIKTDTGSPYIRFGSDSLPGCYANNGAYLKGTDPDKAYSTLLAAFMANRSVQLFYTVNESSSGWSLCSINALYVQ